MSLSRSITTAWFAGAFLASGVLARAQDATTTADIPSAIHATSSWATTRPLFTELNEETQSLFKQVSSTIVRVQLPAENNIFVGENPLDKWGSRIDPAARQRLEQMLQHAPASTFVRAEIRPSTTPSVAGANPSSGEGQHIIVLQLTRFVPNSMGIVFDDEQHVLVSRFVDKSAFTGPVPLVLADGRLGQARFVASDRQSDLTVLQLVGVKGTPADLTDAKPPAGTFLLVMSLNPAMNRLAVWEGWEPDVAALVTIDGKIAGFTNAGQYMSAMACHPAVNDLIEHGVVQRAFLGVAIEMVGPGDPQRSADPELGASPALRVRGVINGSAAMRAGLQPGDLILSLAGQSVGDGAAFATAIANRRGETPIAILRNGQKQKLTADLRVP
ncbi:MAG: S1C family serine protease [Planctomycetota bacterium]|nr:S1C family serine protease [Planctomycetota bacterium]